MAKTARALEVPTNQQICLSFQVLQESYANAVNPKKLGTTPAEAADWCNAWLQCPIASPGLETFVRTVELAHRYQINNSMLVRVEHVVLDPRRKHSQRRFCNGSAAIR